MFGGRADSTLSRFDFCRVQSRKPALVRDTVPFSLFAPTADSYRFLAQIGSVFSREGSGGRDDNTIGISPELTVGGAKCAGNLWKLRASAWNPKGHPQKLPKCSLKDTPKGAPLLLKDTFPFKMLPKSPPLPASLAGLENERAQRPTVARGLTSWSRLELDPPKRGRAGGLISGEM